MRQIAEETRVMAGFAARRGLEVPEKTLARMLRIDALLARLEPGPDGEQGCLTDDETGNALRDLTRTHRKLAEAVAPATPASIKETESGGGLIPAIPNVSVIRKMLALALLSLGAYVLMLCLQDRAVTDTVETVYFQLQLLGAAGLGASFHALFKANEYVTKGTFDTKYAMSYYIRFFLGLIAGPIIANTLVSLTSGAGPEPGGIANDLSLANLGPTAAALLGGYSADAVNRLLSRLVDMLTTLVRGDTKDILKAREEEIRARYGKQQLEQKRDLSTRLMELRAQVSDQETARQIDGIIGELVEQEQD